MSTVSDRHETTSLKYAGVDRIIAPLIIKSLGTYCITPPSVDAFLKYNAQIL